MKEKIHYAIEAALVIAVIILFTLQFSSGNKKDADTRIVVSDTLNASEIMPIAYIDIDSLASTYSYSIELNDRIARKFESSQLSLAEKARKFQSEADDFQRKIEMKIFATQERMDAEQQRLIKLHEDLQLLENRLTQELEQERFVLHEEFRNTIILQVAEFNKDKGYQIILSKTNDNILFSSDVYDITAEVIEYLNLQYAKSPVLKPNE